MSTPRASPPWSPSYTLSHDGCYYESSNTELDHVDQLLNQYAQDPIVWEDLLPLDANDANPAGESPALSFDQNTDLVSFLDEITSSPTISKADMPLPRTMSTSSPQSLPQWTSVLDQQQSVSLASYSFLAPGIAETFQDQSTPRKRGRPILVHMDQASPLLPTHPPVAEAMARQVLWRIDTNTNTNTSTSTGAVCANTCVCPFESSGPSSFLSSTQLCLQPSTPTRSFLQSAPIDYFSSCLSYPSTTVSSSGSTPVMASPTSTANPSWSLVPIDYSSTSFSSSSSCPCASDTSSPRSSSSSSPSSQSSFTATVDGSSPSPAKPKTIKSNRANKAKSMDYYFAPPFQYTDSKIDRRSFNARKELKYAQALAQAQQAQEQDRRHENE